MARSGNPKGLPPCEHRVGSGTSWPGWRVCVCRRCAILRYTGWRKAGRPLRAPAGIITQAVAENA